MAERDETAPKGGDKPTGTIDPEILSEDQLAADRMGNNQLQAKDQVAQHNERKSQAGGNREPDENTLDAFRKMDDES